jgi:LAGLIDADG endonuclease
MPTSERLAYLAGFFDGEGHISLAKRLTRKKHKNGTVCEYQRHQLQIAVSQKTREPLDLFVKEFGGSLVHKTHLRSYDKVQVWRWDWVLSTAAAVAALKAMRPYLIVKASQADIAFEFASTLSRNLAGRKGHGPEMAVKRDLLAAAMKEARANAVTH